MQKGFIFPSLYIYLGLGAVILTLGMVIKYQSVRLELADQFKTSVESLGEAARKEKKRIEAQNKLNKEKADETLRKLRSDNDKFKRLRDNAGSRGLPKPPAETRRPDLSCFDRTELERAYGELVKEVRGIADEGTEATIGLNTAKQWAGVHNQ